MTRIQAQDLVPGDQVWLSRKVKGMLSRDQWVTVTGYPHKSETTDAWFFQARDIVGGHTLTVCTSGSLERVQ